tara:strand:+ start:175 stop:942 length:768 start_codon:yes stop_codon:yes gene_type:complete
MVDKEKYSYKQETKASEENIKHRDVLYKLFKERPMPDDQLLINQGLYMRSSALAKILFINEMFEMIIDIPGIIVEFGCWYGQNLVLFENLRAIYEPFNQSRRIVGFDTFKGYTSFTEKDVKSETVKEGSYNLSNDYKEYLEKLIDFHEKNNVLSNIKKHQIIEGDVTQSVPKYFNDHTEAVVALAYIDCGLYKPVKVCIETILPHLIPGSVIMLDEFNAPEQPGETIAFREVMKENKYSVIRSKYINDRTFIIME